MKTPHLFLEQISLKEKTIEDICTSGDMYNRATGESAKNTINVALRDIRTSDEEIVKRYPAADMEKAVRQKLMKEISAVTDETTDTKQRHLLHLWRGVGIAAAAACCIFAFSIVQVKNNTGKGGTDFVAINQNELNPLTLTDTNKTERIKGRETQNSQNTAPKLFIYKKDGNNIVLLGSRTHVDADDILQVSYLSGSDTYGAIFSVDGNGVVTQHFPDLGNAAAKLVTGREVSLDFAYKLDDAPGFERFFFVSGSKPFSFNEFKTQISGAAKADTSFSSEDGFSIPDTLPANVHVTDILLIK